MRLLGLLSSDHDGERATAGRKADQLLRSLGLVWVLVIIDEPEPDPEPGLFNAL